MTYAYVSNNFLLKTESTAEMKNFLSTSLKSYIFSKVNDEWTAINLKSFLRCSVALIDSQLKLRTKLVFFIDIKSGRGASF